MLLRYEPYIMGFIVYIITSALLLLYMQKFLYKKNINQSTDEDFNSAISYFNTWLQNKKENGMDMKQNML